MIIIGAGGHAKVVYEILRFHKEAGVYAAIDNKKPVRDEKIIDIPILGGHEIIPDLYNTKGIKTAIVAVGDNEIRKEYYLKLKDMGFQIINAVHPNAYVSPTAQLGEGVVICPLAEITTEAKIGNNCIINSGTIVEHETILGDHSHLASRVVIAGRTKIGENTFIGAGTVVKDYVNIGKNVKIGAGSVVLEDIPDNVTAVGAPARVVKKREG